MIRVVTAAVLTLTLAGRVQAQDPVPPPAPAPAPAPAPMPPPPPAPEAAPSNSIRPGMTEAEVRAAWGEPLVVRRANEWTYLFYQSGVEHIHRFNDVVFLQNGQVVDAVIRAPGRTYLGQSSSPPTRAPENTPPATRPNP